MRTRVAVAVAALSLAAGCSTAHPTAHSHGVPAAPKTATGSLEQLAVKARCKPDIQTDARELRQANCSTGQGRYVLLTFATDRGQREWLNSAEDYGGTYLLGRRWVAVGDTGVVAGLRGRLGGTVEAGSQHHQGSSGSGRSDGHSGHHTS
ncbi:hypothetical protein AB0M87_28075 [Streptomyces sp. NPDC051320]|uniref:hypothetical protein n=1 Tax=Streptomyces sp. NPDC051320 TaxID=3154644 RepID=UPI00341E6C7F